MEVYIVQDAEFTDEYRDNIGGEILFVTTNEEKAKEFCKNKMKETYLPKPTAHFVPKLSEEQIKERNSKILKHIEEDFGNYYNCSIFEDYYVYYDKYTVED